MFFSGRLKVAIEITKLDPSWPVTKLRLTAILFRAFRAVFIDNPGASARAWCWPRCVCVSYRDRCVRIAASWPRVQVLRGDCFYATGGSAGAPGRFPESKREPVSVPSCKHAPRFATHLLIAALIVFVVDADCRQLVPRTAAALRTQRDDQRHVAARRHQRVSRRRLADDPSHLYVRAVRRGDGGGETDGCDP